MTAAVRLHPARLPRESRESDEDLVERILGGDAALYAVLMRRYNQRLYRAARSIVRDEAEAEDVVQQAYISAYRNLHQFRAGARFSTWLTRIAIHEALSRVRRLRRHRELLEQGPVPQAPEVPDPELEATRSELRALLERAIDALPEAYRLVLMLRDVEHMSTGDAADALGLSEENVRVRLHRARAMLRQELYRRAGESSNDVFAFAGARCDRTVRRVFERLGLATGI